MNLRQTTFLQQRGVKVSFTYGDNPSIHIQGSYQIKTKEERKIILNYIHSLDEYKKLKAAGFTRTYESQLREWSGHNFLYNIGYKRHRTADVDIDQNSPFYKNFLYSIFSLLEK